MELGWFGSPRRSIIISDSARKVPSGKVVFSFVNGRNYRPLAAWSHSTCLSVLEQIHQKSLSNEFLMLQNPEAVPVKHMRILRKPSNAPYSGGTHPPGHITRGIYLQHGIAVTEP